MLFLPCLWFLFFSITFAIYLNDWFMVFLLKEENHERNDSTPMLPLRASF